MKNFLFLFSFLISGCFSAYPQCTPTVTIFPDKTSTCEWVPVTFTAIVSNEGTAPVYEWFINNISQGTSNSAGTFTTSALSSFNNSVSVKLTSNAACATTTQVTSSAVVINMYPPANGGIIGSDQSICYNTTPGSITNIVLPTTTTSPLYNWESATSSFGPWTLIDGATNSTYTPDAALIADTYYRRTSIDQSMPAPCNIGRSNSVHITVAPVNAATTVSINNPGMACSGTVVIYNATVNAGSNPVYQWYIGTTPVGTNDANYAYTSDLADNGKLVTVKLTSGACNASGSITSNAVPIDLVNSVTPTVSITASAGAICAGIPIKFTATSTGAGTAPAYQWYVNSTPEGTGGTSFTTTALNNADQVSVNMTSSISCVSGGNSTAVSNKISVEVKPIPAPTIVETDQTICAGESIVLHADNISAASILQWQFNAANIHAATNVSYAASQAGQYVIVEDNGYCTSASMPVTLTIDPCSDFSTFISGPNTATPGQQNVAYSVTNQTGFTYLWNVTGGTIASGQHTNAIAVDWDGGSSSAVSRTANTQQKVSVTETKQSTNLSKTTSLTVNNTSTTITTSLAQSGIQFYPNPSADAFNIVMPQSGTLVQYSITDLSGMSVASGTFTSSGSAEKITTNFNTGLYQVVLKYNETVTCLRLNKVQ